MYSAQKITDLYLINYIEDIKNYFMYCNTLSYNASKEATYTNSLGKGMFVVNKTSVLFEDMTNNDIIQIFPEI